jgi:hypothetical protein
MKKITETKLFQDMGLKIGERFKVGRYTMVYANHDRGSKWDEIVSLKVWKFRQRLQGS